MYIASGKICYLNYITCIAKITFNIGKQDKKLL